MVANLLTSPAPLDRIGDWAGTWAVEEVFGIEPGRVRILCRDLLTWEVEGLLRVGMICSGGVREGIAVAGLLERGEAARRRVKELRHQAARVAGQLAEAEEALNRLVVTRETIEEVLAEPREEGAAAAPEGPARRSGRRWCRTARPALPWRTCRSPTGTCWRCSRSSASGPD
jgi:hypothetical protein